MRTYAAECVNHASTRQFVQPGTDAHAHVCHCLSGIDPLTLPTAEDVAKAILPLCLADCAETGKLYNFREKKFLDFRAPA